MAELNNDEIQSALLRLVAKTKSHEVKWVLDASQGMSVTPASRFRFYISSVNSNDAAPYCFEIWRLYEVDGKQRNFKVGEIRTIDGGLHNLQLAELFSLARMSWFEAFDLSKELIEDLP